MSTCSTKALVQSMLNQCILAEMDYKTTFAYFDRQIQEIQHSYKEIIDYFNRNAGFVSKVSPIEGAWQFTPYDITVIQNAIVVLNKMLLDIANGNIVPLNAFDNPKLLECGLKRTSVYGKADTTHTGYYSIILDNMPNHKVSFVVPVDHTYIDKVIEPNNPNKQCLYINVDATDYPASVTDVTNSGWKVATAKDWDIIGQDKTESIVPETIHLANGDVIKRATFDICTRVWNKTTATITFDEGTVTPIIVEKTEDITWENCGWGWYYWNNGATGMRLNSKSAFDTFCNAYGQPEKFKTGYGYLAENLHIVSIVDNNPEHESTITGLPVPQFYEVKEWLKPNTYYYFDDEKYQPIPDSFKFYDNGRMYWYLDEKTKQYVRLNIGNDEEYKFYLGKYGKLYVSPTEGYIPVKQGETYVNSQEEFNEYLSKYGKLYCRYWQLFLHTYDPTYDVYEHVKESSSIKDALYLYKFWRGRFSRHQNAWSTDLSSSRVLNYISAYKWDKLLDNYIDSFKDVVSYFGDADKTPITHESLFRHIPIKQSDDETEFDKQSMLLFQLGNIWAVRHELIRVFYAQLRIILEEGNRGVKLK